MAATSPIIRDVPCRHVIIDHFADTATLQAINDTWPGPDWAEWVTYAEHGKHASSAGACPPYPAAALLARMAALPIGRWLGMPDSVPDLCLWGAGHHEMVAGGSLGLHLDADTHPRLGLKRAWSAALYVHMDWAPDLGGELILGDERGPFALIDPRPGRLVAFDVRDTLHAVRRCAFTRRSLALFGYLPEAGAGRRMRAEFR